MSTYQISDSELDVLSEKVANDDALLHKLVSLRGGCSCHINPPCRPCCSELTAEEAIELGIIEEFEP